MVLRTFCRPSRSKGSLGAFFLDSSLKVTFLGFIYSNAFLFSKSKMCFSTAMASFVSSAKVGLAAPSTKIAAFKGRA